MEKFLHKDTKHKKNYTESLNSINKNIKDDGFPKDSVFNMKL